MLRSRVRAPPSLQYTLPRQNRLGYINPALLINTDIYLPLPQGSKAKNYKYCLVFSAVLCCANDLFLSVFDRLAHWLVLVVRLAFCVTWSRKHSECMTVKRVLFIAIYFMFNFPFFSFYFCHISTNGINEKYLFQIV